MVRKTDHFSGYMMNTITTEVVTTIQIFIEKR